MLEAAWWGRQRQNGGDTGNEEGGKSVLGGWEVMVQGGGQPSSNKCRLWGQEARVRAPTLVSTYHISLWVPLELASDKKRNFVITVNLHSLQAKFLISRRILIKYIQYEGAM